ncbi:site-specific integrase [Pseudocnuella soli]|uniref:site-specific integrase n=1 Tax=Pseudocnuella soli TaxID=2502779 RepID=UPI00104FF822|nr:site-specific integrase [Pseudocnuella soli]
MKSTNPFSVHFVARTFKTTPGELHLYVRISVAHKRLEISLKKKVPADQWDVKSGSVKGNKKLMQELNPYLQDVRFQLMECVRHLHLEKRKVTAQAIKSLFLGTEEGNQTLCGLMRYHNENMKTVLAPGTLKNYFTTERYVKLFLERKHKTKDIHLSELNFQFITEFEIFLRKTAPLMESNPLTNNGIMKHMERLRKMVTLAAKMEWIPKDPFQRYTLRFQKVDKTFLSPAELTLVESADLPSERLQVVRDLFVFSCYTGLAYADVTALQPAHICIGMDGAYWIKTARCKTAVAVNVPLLPQAKAIMDRYRADPRAAIRNRVFPRLSNQKMNAYLKEIALYCDLSKSFTFHTARHTFATTVTLSNGVPIETVSKMLGHTKLSTTQIYARVLEQKVGADMSQLCKRLGQLQ